MVGVKDDTVVCRGMFMYGGVKDGVKGGGGGWNVEKESKQDLFGPCEGRNSYYSYSPLKKYCNWIPMGL